jgi:hypothetical protein
MALVYENKVPASYRVAFINKVKSICAKLGIDPNWLMAIINFESAGTFSPSITNPIGAVGLIQFMPATAKGLGTTSASLKSMTAVQQLDYVYKYFLPYKGKINNYIDTYFAVFFPLAIGKDDDWVIQTNGISSSIIAKQNPAFDTNKDGKVYVWEVKKVMLERLPSEWLKNGSFSLAVKSYSAYFLFGIAAIVGYFAYKKFKK